MYRGKCDRALSSTRAVFAPYSGHRISSDPDVYAVKYGDATGYISENFCREFRLRLMSTAVPERGPPRGNKPIFRASE